MKTLLSIVLWLLVLLVLGLFSWIITLYLAWPWWGGLAIFFGVIGVYFGLKLLRRLWVVSRSRVKLAASERIGRKGADKPGALADLTQKWKDGIATLRKSSLRRFGNPIYALPWFMVVGESGVGKTSAITRSRLGSLNKSISQFEPIVQTLNCDWWFFNRAVVIDTAGRYVSPDGNSEDQAEWERMLELLSKYRLKEGLNGLVLAVDAEQLLQDNHDALERRGHAIRERIDQLIRLFDRRFPIFILVTKCDLVFGFEQWAQVLPAESLNQAMGYVGQIEEGDGAEQRFLNTAYSEITDRLKLLRLDMGVKGVDLTPELLLFPNELDRLRTGLQRFLSACAGNNPYLEQPLLRGLFFSSAHQAGAAVPAALANMIKGPIAQGAPADKGLFLHDFFERILPADRWTFLPTVIVNRWRQVTRNLAAVFWVSIFTAILVFLLVSYYQTRSSLHEIETAYPTQAVSEARQNVSEMDDLHDILSVIDLILARQDDWQTRWLAFSPDITQLEEDIKQDYVHGYQNFLRSQSPETLFNRIATHHNDNSPLYANAVLALVRSINLSQARLNGADYNELLAMPQIPPAVIRQLRPDLPTALVNAADRMQVAYKAWTPVNDPFLQEQLARDRETLQKLITQSPELEWLLPWADALPALQPVTLREFWLPGSQGKTIGSIQPALTHQGELALQSFLNELDQAVNHSFDFKDRRQAFEAWYLSERFNTWQSFAWSFPNGEQLLVNEPAWRDMLTRIDTDTSPYYRFFDRLKAEFAALPTKALPPWLVFAREFNAMRHAATATGSLDKAKGMIGTLNTVGERVIQQSVASKSFAPIGEVPQSISGVRKFSDYANAFDIATSQALEGEGKAYQLAADYFSFNNDPKVKTSALQSVYDNLAAFKESSGFNTPDDQVIWQLVGGPLRLLTRYALEQGSCSAQKAWERDVLWHTQMAVSAKETNEQLFGDKGSVWAFADGPAKPFLVQSASGFRAAAKNEFEFPFSGSFVPFLNTSVSTRVETVVKSQLAEASVGKSATLLITSRPVGVNPGATAKPYAVNLSIQCSQQEITLDNYNMQVTNSFDWSPDQCGDVNLQIRIDNLTLNRRYPGPMGLAHFVGEFTDGERVFTPDDFPQARDQLAELNVKTISVRYDFTGQDAVLKLAEHLEYLNQTETPSLDARPASLAIKVPERVGVCWTGGRLNQPVTPLPQYIRQRADKIIDQPPPPPEPARIQAMVDDQEAKQAKQAKQAKPSGPTTGKAAGHPATTQASRATTTDKPDAVREHRVEAGETLFSLARQFGTTVETLKQLNGITDTNLIVTGSIIKLPDNRVTDDPMH